MNFCFLSWKTWKFAILQQTVTARTPKPSPIRLLADCPPDNKNPHACACGQTVDKRHIKSKLHKSVCPLFLWACRRKERSKGFAKFRFTEFFSAANLLRRVCQKETPKRVVSPPAGGNFCVAEFPAPLVPCDTTPHGVGSVGTFCKAKIPGGLCHLPPFWEKEMRFAHWRKL